MTQILAPEKSNKRTRSGAMRFRSAGYRRRRKSQRRRLWHIRWEPKQLVKYAIRIVNRAGMKNHATDTAIMGKGKRPPIILDGIPPSNIASA